ncbi:MAG TPA: hypothetical protein VGH42_10850 [Verrucomicrobiae bacterium]|jgi:hypothetical protein
MKTSYLKTYLAQKAGSIVLFIDGVCSGLLIAYFISAFSHPLPDAVLFSACGSLTMVSWLLPLPSMIRFKEQSYDLKYDA